MKTVKYDVWSLDVWGNAADGFEVNDRSCHARAVEFPATHQVFNEGTEHEFSNDWPTDQQIVDTLIEIEYLNSTVKLGYLDINGGYEYSLYVEQAGDGFPLCQLEYVE